MGQGGNGNRGKQREDAALSGPRRVESSCHQQTGEVARQRGPVGRSTGSAAKLGRWPCRRDCFDGRSEEKMGCARCSRRRAFICLAWASVTQSGLHRRVESGVSRPRGGGEGVEGGGPEGRPRAGDGRRRRGGRPSRRSSPPAPARRSEEVKSTAGAFDWHCGQAPESAARCTPATRV